MIVSEWNISTSIRILVIADSDPGFVICTVGVEEIHDREDKLMKMRMEWIGVTEWMFMQTQLPCMLVDFLDLRICSRWK